MLFIDWFLFFLLFIFILCFNCLFLFVVICAFVCLKFEFCFLCVFFVFCFCVFIVMVLILCVFRYVRPDREMFEGAEMAVREFESLFDLQEVESKEDNKKKRIYWRDIIRQEDAKNQEIEVNGIKQEVNAKQKLKDKDVFVPDQIKEISTVDPINDFKIMISDRHSDRVSEAITQLKALIIRFVKDSYQGSAYPKALDCLSAFRDAAVKEDEATEFNDFLIQIKNLFSKGRHIEFWNMIKIQQITLITKEETTSSLLTEEEANEFLSSDAKEVKKEQEEEQVEDDDLMAEIE
jgi:ATP-dependent DNA helicase 2 subunit 2